jgi:hypothetical protein
MIVGWAVHEEESSYLAGALISEACLRQAADPDKFRTRIIHIISL